ncbi:unnamed protein product [Microthlaspi erraticum]|uniref:Pectate lyase superfamily protein domain-containing protein n=1 Tax=Microthlaspi erraticum TaxID=1685480 RepID=A0A6D2LJQ0_9BRAS|nr:unnamed protein product [Microthlaspi erraticum]
MEAWSDPKSPMWISFSNVVGLSIIGLGTINGGGSPFWEALHINKCDNLKINGITSIDSPRHHISINSCNGAAISQINLFAPEDSPNTDGIDLRDDCIAINTGSININITNINCGPGHGISVGSLGANGETATVSNVQVTHCTFNQTLNGARIKTWPGGQGYARNISFEDITLINSKNPIVIDQNYRDKGLLDGTEAIVKFCISILISFLCFALVNGQNYNVLNFGAKGDGQTDDSKAFVKTWSAACGGGEDIKTLLIPAGKTFLLQPIVFQGPCRSKSIKVQLDGIIVAPSNKEAWSNLKSQRWIGFSTVSGLTIVGSGTINGRAKVESFSTTYSEYFYYVYYVLLMKTARGGDDCIAINTGNFNINITRINCGPGHGISVGSLGADGEKAAVSNVQVTNCTFNQTTNGARIKTWPGGAGYARNIRFENITLIDVKNPIIINQQYIDKRRLNDAEDSAVAISNVIFVGFHGTTSSKDAITLDCSETTRCEGVVIDGINITMADGEKPKFACNNVDGNSDDTSLMRGCFKNV